MDAALFNEVFRLRHARPSTNQDPVTCTRLAQHVCDFVNGLESADGAEFAFSLVDPLVHDRNVPLHELTHAELSALKRVTRVLATKGTSDCEARVRGDVWVEQWLPKYGCALLMEMTSVSCIALRLVYPDAWRHAVHFLPGDECVHSAVPQSFGVLNCGSVRPADKTALVLEFDRALRKAQLTSTADRRAGPQGALGHQKTPQFIAAVVMRARAAVVGCSSSAAVVRGGTTDVGLHTGGSYRDTCWSIVQAVIQQNLPGAGVLFEKATMLFQLALVRRKTTDVAAQGTAPIAIVLTDAEDAFAMLQTVVVRVVKLVDRGYNAGKVEDQCCAIRADINALAVRVNKATAKLYRLPSPERLHDAWASMAYPEVAPLKYTNSFKHPTAGALDAAAHTHEQIGSLDCVDPSSCSLEMLVTWVRSSASKFECKNVGLLVMRSTEQFLFARASRLETSKVTVARDDCLEDVRYLLSAYEECARQWSNDPLGRALFDVEQRSLELVVKWIGFCLVHRTLVQDHALLARYAIALQWQDLCVAVLKEQVAVDALLHVAAYIRAWNQSRSAALFDPRNHAPAIELAQSFARGSRAHQRRYADEVERVAQAVARTWRTITYKKETAANLRAEIRDLEATLAQHERALVVQKAEHEREHRHLDWYRRPRDNSAIRQTQHVIHQTDAMLGKRRRLLTEALAMPPFVVSPLPASETLALEVLFFLEIPSDLALLGELCLSAQRALASPARATSQALAEAMPSLSWRKHFNARSSGPDMPEMAFTAFPGSLAVPYSYGPTSVDSLGSETQYAQQCVWYPPTGTSRIYWQDASGMSVSPFSITRELMDEHFVHQLPRELQSLQWAIATPGGDKRGNLVYSMLYEWYPDAFDQHAFIQFGSLRAFPNQQIRKLCCALKANVLPWDHASVKATVRQAMYQVGELTDTTPPALLWKSDIHSDNGLAILCSALDGVAATLEQTPRKVDDVPLLSELAASISQRTARARDVASKFAAMCQRWATNEREQSQSCQTLSADALTDFRANECVRYGYALQSYALGTLSDVDLDNVGTLLLLFRNSMLYAGSSALWPKIQRLDVVAADMMARRIHALVAFIERRGIDVTLTRWLQAVNQRANDGLKWMRVDAHASSGHAAAVSYAARDSATDTHFVLNVFNGSVLTDGNSPGGLPLAMRTTATFQSLFGEQDFEVVCSRGGVYRTTRAIHGCFLEFRFVKRELRVRQLFLDAHKAVAKTLELCSATWLRALTNALPARVVQLHSLWHWVEENCVLAHPLETARSKHVAFVVTIDTRDGNIDQLQCYQVATADTRASHNDLLRRLEQYDSVVTTPRDLVRVLQKFEDRAFIHALRSPAGELKIHLPRFRLTFVLETRGEYRLASKEYEGYSLDPTQRFMDVFGSFRRYLVLRLNDASSALSKPVARILAPVGQVVKDAAHTVDVAVSTDASANLNVAVFDVHRRLGTFSTESIMARLQLAALLVAAGTAIPSTFLHMTGAEAALRFLRGCYVSHALSKREQEALQSVCRYGHREPALKILANSLLHKSARCGFLAGTSKRSGSRGGATSPVSIDCSNELDAYCAMCVEQPERNALRVRLDAVEEKTVLGTVLQQEMRTKHARSTRERVVELDLSPVCETFVRDIEAKLQQCLAPSAANTAMATPPLPLKQLTDDVMGREMNNELRESWRAFHSNPHGALRGTPAALAATFESLLSDVQRARRTQQEYLFACIANVRAADPCSQLLLQVNYLPTPTVSDVIRSSFDSDVLLLLLPHLSLTGRSRFKTATLQFMELCVLEDKLERLVHGAQQQSPPSDTYFVDELSSVRRWSSAEHPYWLAFEVEGRLQIRHEQFVVAQHLIDNTGAVCQMNMGRGKTRVILPILFLYFSHRHRGQRVARAHFLTSLLSETRQFMHRHLSASSVLGLHFVELPFHRDIDIDADRLQLIQEVLDEAKSSGKFLMIAPEHRMSLELKHLELAAASAGASGAGGTAHSLLTSLLDPKQYVDVLDESDAVLHHKYHLVYAVGAPQKLYAGEDRWSVVEALMCTLDSVSESRVSKVLAQPHVSFRSPEYVSRPGGFTGLRLNASVANKNAVRLELKRALALDLMDSSSFSLQWLRALRGQNDELQECLVRAITDPGVSLDDALAGLNAAGVSRFRNRLLALRGLVAFGILEYCLEKRHRVDFGLPDAGARKKRLAIPFRAADIPSERSEFSHPEVGITLTVLAYYHTGLSEREMKETLQQLLQLGLSEQSQTYKRWYATVRAALAPETLSCLPTDALQLSPKDARQCALLHSVYRFSMEPINFFLNTCVFPSDTTQYPQRLSRTAWHLAGGSWNIGFSGTNDNHRLLPLSVRQHEPDEPSLVGTNGKMIDRAVRVFQGYAVIWTDVRLTETPWRVLLRLAIDKRAHALIDTGALLAGVLNNDAAAYLLELDSFRGFAGVTYYDTRKQFDCWVVLDASTKHVAPLKNATVLERDTFVIFDDARSRGSDMKLRSDAVAVLTLGPKLTKDKLMQGAGRMRQLGCDQTLWFVSLGEVAQSILQVCGKSDVARVGAADILDWVMETTKSEVVHGLIEWASSGLHFSKTQRDPDAELVEEDWTLEWLYSHAHRPEYISTIVRNKVQKLFGGSGSSSEDATSDGTAALDTLVRAICERGATYGCDSEVLVATHSEECERELHVDVEEDRICEVKQRCLTAASERVWEYTRLLVARSVSDLRGVVDVQPLSEYVREHLAPHALLQIRWGHARVFGTANVFSTVVAPTLECLNDLTRVVDAMVLFADGSVLLLSEYEADRVLQLLWTHQDKRVGFTFLNLAFAVDARDERGADATVGDVAWALGDVTSGARLCPSLATTCQLFNGETNFAARRVDIVEHVLRTLLEPVRERERVLQDYCARRGHALKWSRSLLHELCHAMDLEDFAARQRQQQQSKRV